MAREAVETLNAGAQCPTARPDMAPLPPVVWDPIQTSRLFRNLIGNAVLYRDRDPDRPLRIHVSGSVSAGRVTERIADNGLGIDPHERPRAFQMFSRLQGPEHSSGTGMGLALCHRIVEHHGGQIALEGRRGDGCTVVPTLPAAEAAQTPPTAPL